MTPTRPPVRPALLLLALGAATAPALAITCDELRSTIDARIRAGGVGSFSLNVVAASASAPGSVVGTCEQGAKKIFYVKGTGAAGTPAPAPAPRAAVASTAPAAPAAQPKAAAAADVITECDDGASVTHGECKKP